MPRKRERSVILDLGESGTRLWREFNADDALAEDDRVVLLEACRLADRCDRLDGILAGDAGTWATIAYTQGSLSIVVDKALAEARQHAVALARLVSHLRRVGEGAEAGAGEVPPGVTSLTERVAAKRASASG